MKCYTNENKFLFDANLLRVNCFQYTKIDYSILDHNIYSYILIYMNNVRYAE